MRDDRPANGEAGDGASGVAEPLRAPLPEAKESAVRTAALPDAEPRPNGAAIALSAVGALLSGRLDREALAEQILELALRSLPIALLCLAFIGVVLEEHAAHEARRAFIGLDQVGPMFFQLTIREFAPAISGIVVAARVGSGIAAEIGWMAQTEQIDALRLLGRDLAADVYGPRLAAGLLASVLAALLGVAAAGFAGGLWAHATAGGHLAAFVSLRLIGARDWLLLAAKAVASGVAVPLAAVHAGLELGGKPDGVARATSAGVVRGTLWVLAADVAIGATLWWLP